MVDETSALGPNLGIMAKVCSPIEVLRLREIYELVYQLWAQFTLSAVRANVDVTWSRDEVLFNLSTCSVMTVYHVCIQLAAFLVHHSIILNGMYPRI